MSAERIFLLSPAHCGGKRAELVFNERAQFEVARKLRETGGVPIGEVFSFLSGLYFRGKLAYSRHFACVENAYAITSNRGLVRVDTLINLDDLRAFGGVSIDTEDERYRVPLERDSREVAGRLSSQSQVVLLGSIATGKYVNVLLEIFGERLHFPEEFVGRGDMSRGGLMLRCVEEGRELSYVPVRGAVRNGKRPPKLERRAGKAWSRLD